MELTTKSVPQYKYFTTFALVYLTIMVASTSVAYKPVEIFGFTATASSLLFALTFAISSVIAEVYGKEKSRQLINIIIPCGLLFSLFVTFVPDLPSPSDWHHESAYNYVFGGSLRFAIFGTIGSFISYRINIYLITKWKFLTKGKYFPLRTVGANTCGEFFLVLITTFGAFYGMFPFHQVISMFWFAYLSKIVYALVLSWPAAIAAVAIKRKEGVDVYD